MTIWSNMVVEVNSPSQVKSTLDGVGVTNENQIQNKDHGLDQAPPAVNIVQELETHLNRHRSYGYYLEWKGNVHSHYACHVLLMILGYNHREGEIIVIPATVSQTNKI